MQTVLTFRQSKPIVIDADALNLLAKRKDLQAQCDAACILTPHLGEMSRLAECTISDLKYIRRSLWMYFITTAPVLSS